MLVFIPPIAILKETLCCSCRMFTSMYCDVRAGHFAISGTYFKVFIVVFVVSGLLLVVGVLSC